MYKIPIVRNEDGVGILLGLSSDGTATLLLTTPVDEKPQPVTLLKEDWAPLYQALYPFVWRIISLADEVKWELGGHTVLFSRFNESFIHVIVDGFRVMTFHQSATFLSDALQGYFDFTPPPLAPLLPEV